MSGTRRLAWLAAAVLGAAVGASPASAALSKEAVNGAQFKRPVRSSGGVSPVVAKAQILLDRAFFSPGVIDGIYGGNMKKALAAYQSVHGLSRTGVLDAPTWKALTGKDQTPALIAYTIQKAHVDGPFAKSIPGSMKKMAKLKRLAYTSPVELLAEKFHMDQDFLRRLNLQADFKKAGTKIIVANVAGRNPAGSVAKVVVGRKSQAVKAFDKNGRLLAFYPATVGSRQFPSPAGNLKVVAVAERPVFTYSGDLEYAKLKKGQVIKVPPGPNNPVGLVWIDLNKDGYGIHGTPTPAEVSKNASHGCVRLTNWDALELAAKVEKGIPVRFAG